MDSSPLLFLSHAGEDAAAAREMARLLREAGLRVWLDLDELQPGDRWMEAFESALTQADAFAVYVGQSGVVRWVDREVRLALDRNAREPGFRVVPILGPGSDPAGLPAFLRQHQWLDLRSARAGELKKLMGAVLAEPPSKLSLLPPDQPPFRGLLAFEAADALLFFGRDREVGELLERLRSGRFVAVVGDSGSGKSSLVRAGLIPTLHRGRFQDGTSSPEAWQVAILRPGDDPFRELGNALPDLAPALSAAERLDVLQKCRALLAVGVTGLYDSVVTLVPRGTRALVVVDQFEELFTLVSKADDRRRFVDSLLRAAVGEGDHPVHVLVTLRADFYSRCWEHPLLPQHIAANQYAVHRMGHAQLRDVIEHPLALAGAHLEPGLADAILEDVGEEPGSLPLLEHALLQLWERRSGTTLTHAAYVEIGRLSGALARKAEGVYRGLAEGKEQEAARKIFLKLTQPGEGTEDTRRRARKEELLALGTGSDVAEKVLLLLARERLVTTAGAIGTPDDTVDVAHEALIRGWPRLRMWLDEDRDALRVERRLMAAAAEWTAADRDADLLYRGVRLTEADAWARTREADLTPKQLEFLEQSRAGLARAKRQRLALIAGTVLAAILTAFASLGYARVQRKYAGEQQQRVRSGLAEREFVVLDLLSAKPAEALTYAVQAAGQSLSLFGDVTRPVKAALTVAVEASRERYLLTTTTDNRSGPLLAISPHGHVVTQVAGQKGYQLRLWDAKGQAAGTIETDSQALAPIVISSDGQTLISQRMDRTLAAWRSDGRLVRRIARDRPPNAMASAGNVIAIASDSSIELWNSTGDGPPEILDQGPANALVFAPDGRLLAASRGNTIRLWDPTQRKETTVLTGHTANIHAMAMSHNGKLLASGNGMVLVQDAGEIRVWDLTDFTLRRSIDVSGSAVRSLAFSSNDRFLVAGVDNRVEIWDLEGRQVNSVLRGHASPVTFVGVLPDANIIVSGSTDGTVRYWDFPEEPTGRILRHGTPINYARFGRNAQSVITGTAGKKERTTIWNLSADLKPERAGSPLGVPLVLGVSPDGGTVAVGSMEGWLQLLGRDGIRGETRSGSPIWALDYTPDGELIVTGSEDGRMRRWSKQGEPRGASEAHKKKIWYLDVSPDGRYVATASADGTARVWALAGQPVGKPLEGHKGEVTAIKFLLPHGRAVVSGGQDGTLRIWGLNGAPQLAFEAHRGTIYDFDVGSDGRYIVSGGDDRMIRVWQPDGTLLVQFEGHDAPIYSVEFSPDGTSLLTAGQDGTARTWPSRLWNNDDWQVRLNRACERLRYHPLLLNPLSSVGVESCLTCEVHTWKQVVCSKSTTGRTTAETTRLWTPQGRDGRQQPQLR